ncbi:GNAT family N-acetyltransferase [Rheinheimera maricola]|uniref:GNAT family N-acetyltransferase n=1 Tax=Rheinheimera maricola TaxID=2793282 RepID=A0ABS7X8Y4_9GAMM|nr:GNAT family N-acetyltransferase [Rheinheimera maricola]MBZ9612010.1 GNAT family N-acetyltransferase [Rheinheimera maricola]
MQTLLAVTSMSELSQLRNWFQNAEQQQSWGGDNFVYPCSEQQFLQLLCRPGTQSYSLLDRHSGKLLGFGQLCDRFGCHHLARLVIAPPHRGQGLAKQLIFALIMQALSTQQRDISLYVHRHNVVALQCYNRLGFNITTPPEEDNARLYFMTLPADTAKVSVAQYLTQL